MRATRERTRAKACPFERTHVRSHARTHTQMHASTHECIVRTYARTHPCMHACACTHASTHVRMYARTYVLTYVCMYVCMFFQSRHFYCYHLCSNNTKMMRVLEIILYMCLVNLSLCNTITRLSCLSCTSWVQRERRFIDFTTIAFIFTTDKVAWQIKC